MAENKIPSLFRCKGCFKTHFPYKKFCMWHINSQAVRKCNNALRSERILCKVSNHGIVRLRGGANIEGTVPTLVNRAIESAKKTWNQS